MAHDMEKTDDRLLKPRMRIILAGRRDRANAAICPKKAPPVRIRRPDIRPPPRRHDVSLDRPENAPSSDVFGHNRKRRSRHENTGRHFDSGAAYDVRGGIHGPVSDKRSADRARGELKPPFETALGDDDYAFSGSISQADKPAGRRGGVFHRFARFRRSISDPAASENGQRLAFPGRVELDNGPRAALSIRARHNA
jgi:hypothetical protein